jgi:hypothetical protein
MAERLCPFNAGLACRALSSCLLPVAFAGGLLVEFGFEFEFEFEDGEEVRVPAAQDLGAQGKTGTF